VLSLDLDSPLYTRGRTQDKEIPQRKRKRERTKE
jgi:hypothetical protein